MRRAGGCQPLPPCSGGWRRRKGESSGGALPRLPRSPPAHHRALAQLWPLWPASDPAPFLAPHPQGLFIPGCWDAGGAAMGREAGGGNQA